MLNRLIDLFQSGGNACEKIKEFLNVVWGHFLFPYDFLYYPHYKFVGGKSHGPANEDRQDISHFLTVQSLVNRQIYPVSQKPNPLN